MAKQKKLVIIDGHALIHRAYHALPPLTTKTGEVVNAVYGFTMIMLNVLRELDPDYLIVAFDLPGKTKRHDEYEHYKANRSAAPDDLTAQFDRVREVVETFNIPVFTAEGYEADDVIGTLVHKVPKEIQSIIVTGDMDELQLVDDHTRVYTMKRGFTDTMIYDAAAVKARYGLTPSQFVDYKALRGDPSDNIPGVPGVGEKTATDLISTYGTLDAVYNNLDQLKPAVARKLTEGRELAYLSQKLSQIETNLDLKIDLTKAVLHDYDRSKVFTLFQELGFKSLLPKLPGPKNEKKPLGPEKVTAGKRDHLKTARYRIVTTTAELYELASLLNKAKYFAFDTETDSLSEVEANLVGMSFAVKEGEAYYIPVGHLKGLQLSKKLVLDTLCDVLSNPKIGKIGHNLKYDYVVMKNAGVTLAPILLDTMVAAYLLNPNLRSQKLSDLAFSELGLSMIPIEELIGSGKNQKSFAATDINEATRYAAEDADVALRLFNHLTPELKENDLLNLNQEIEAPLIPILGEMERAGINLDTIALTKDAHEIEQRIAALKNSIKKRAGQDLNIASPAQMSEILFNVLKLHERTEHPDDFKKLKGGKYSTGAQELEKLRGTDPIIEEIFEFRELTKLKNTYIDVLPKLVSPRDHRLHTSFNQTIAQTGRLSSSSPNLQNIPIRTTEGQKIRQAFIAGEGMVLLSADYSQIELRVVAHIAKAKNMIQVFLEGRDIHTETAAAVYNVSKAKVTPTMRRVAKIINFGIIYGVSAHGLKQQTGLTREEGQKLINKYFELNPEIKTYSEEMIKRAKELGYVETVFGRKRFLPEISSTNFAVRGAAERMAINMPIQGTAADLMKLAMIDIAKELPLLSPKTRMLLQVHDELVFEVPEKEIELVAEFVQKRMDGVIKLSVPIETAVSWGKNWGETKA